MEMNIFEQASRQNLMYTTERGTVGFSDLWKLKKEKLSELYAELETVRGSCSKGLIASNSALLKKTDLQMAIVKHIFDAKAEEENIAKKRADAKDKLELLSKAKGDAELKRIEAMSPAEIDAEIAKLQELL